MNVLKLKFVSCTLQKYHAYVAGILGQY